MKAAADERTVAERMLEGEICEGCQCELRGEAPGFPRRCADCKKDALPDPRPGTILQVQPKPARKGEPLPKWKLEAEAPFSVRFHCNRCPRHFALPAAVVDHLRDAHGTTVAVPLEYGL